MLRLKNKMNENMETKRTNIFMALYESDSESETESKLNKHKKSNQKSTPQKNVKTDTKSAEMNTSYATAAKVNVTDDNGGKWETVKTKKKKDKKFKNKFKKRNNNYQTDDTESNDLNDKETLDNKPTV